MLVRKYMCISMCVRICIRLAAFLYQIAGSSHRTGFVRCWLPRNHCWTAQGLPWWFHSLQTIWGISGLNMFYCTVDIITVGSNNLLTSHHITLFLYRDKMDFVLSQCFNISIFWLSLHKIIKRRSKLLIITCIYLNKTTSVNFFKLRNFDREIMQADNKHACFPILFIQYWKFDWV